MENTLILFSGRYCGNSGHKFYIYMDFSCSQREQHSEHFVSLCNKDSTCFCTFPAHSYCSPNRLTDFWFFNPSALCFCQMWHISFLFHFIFVNNKNMLVTDRWFWSPSNCSNFCSVWQIKCQGWKHSPLML